MLLKRLVDYGKRIELPPLMYDETHIKWVVDLDSGGDFKKLSITSSGQRRDRGKSYPAPHALVTSGTVPKLLAQTPDYALGIGSTKQERTDKRHRAFVELLKECFKETGSKGVGDVITFLETYASEGCPAIGMHQEEMEKENNLVTFRVDGEFVFDSPGVQPFWAEYQRKELAGNDSARPCMVCGESKIPVKMHPFQIKRVPGGQTSGTAVVSTNFSAALSFGFKEKQQGLSSPICLECADRYGKALNHLIRDEKSRVVVGPILFVFWTREDVPFNPAMLLSSPDPGEVKQLILSYFKGKLAEPGDETDFYATALSASGGRAVIRDWLETTVGRAKENLARWFRLQGLVGSWGDEGEPVGLYGLAASLVRDPRRDIPPNVPKALVKAALEGARLPDWLLHQAIRRNRAEQRVTRPRMVLTKMVLVSGKEYEGKEDKMASLDKENREPAYLCGRLLSVLEQVQRAALPGIKATIIDRYFGTASSAPATVFGTLLKGAQNHLAVLRKTREGAFWALTGRLEEVLNGLDARFPATLNLKEQALFSLGYYHQRAHDRAEAKAKGEKQLEEIVE